MTSENFDTAGYEAMATAVGAWPGSRQVIAASGDDTTTFLQGQLSQDIAALATGASAWSLLLAPQGKIVAWLRVTRRDENDYLLDVDAGWAEAVITRLERFRLRTKCDLTILDWDSLALRGPGSAAVEVEGAAVRASVSWRGIDGVDVLGPALTAPAGVPVVAESAWTAHRIEAGEPMMGPEMDESTIPAAAGIVDRSVSFTKGCYTGQELVARIDSRGGNVPHRLLGLLADANQPALVPGLELGHGDKTVGSVTSASQSASGQPIALAYVARSVAEGDVVTVGDGSATVVGLPFPS